MPSNPRAKPRVIELTPTWEAAVGVCLRLLESGTETGKTAARSELLRLATAVDAMQQAAPEPRTPEPGVLTAMIAVRVGGEIRLLMASAPGDYTTLMDRYEGDLGLSVAIANAAASFVEYAYRHIQPDEPTTDYDWQGSADRIAESLVRTPDQPADKLFAVALGAAKDVMR